MSEEAALMNEALDIFKGKKKQTKYYHGRFDSAYFIAWMKKLLNALDARGVWNAIMVMDSAKYHKSLLKVYHEDDV